MKICKNCSYYIPESNDWVGGHVPPLCKAPGEIEYDPVTGEIVSLAVFCKYKNPTGKCEDFMPRAVPKSWLRRFFSRG